MIEPDQDRNRLHASPIAPTIAPIIAPDDEAAEIARRTEAWAAALKPDSSLKAWIAGQVVMASVRLDRCVHLDRARRRRLAARARTCWDNDRRLEAEIVAQRLAQKPALTVRLLRQTSQGCDWLIARWKGLQATLAAGPWDDSRRSLTLDLLGVPTAEREHDPVLDETDIEALADLARQEIAELEDRKAKSLDELDAHDRQMAAQGLGDDASPEARLLIRYEASCQKVFHWGLAQLGQSRRAPKATPALPSRLARPRPPVPAQAPTTPAPSNPGRRPLAPSAASPPPQRNRRARRALEKLARSA